MNVKKQISSALAHILSFYMLFGGNFAFARSHSAEMALKHAKENAKQRQSVASDECQKLFADYEAKSFCQAVSDEKISKQYRVLGRLEQCIKDAGKLKIEALANQSSAQTMQLAQASGYKDANHMAQQALVDVEKNLAQMQEDFFYPAALSDDEKAEYRESISQVASTRDNAKDHFADCEQKAAQAQRMYFQSAGLTSAAHASAQNESLACESNFNSTKKDYFEFSSQLKNDAQASSYVNQGQLSGQIKDQCATQEQAKGKKRGWILALLAIMAIVVALLMVKKKKDNNGGTSSGRGGASSAEASAGDEGGDFEEVETSEEGGGEDVSRSLAEESSAGSESNTTGESAPSTSTNEEGFVEAPVETFAG